MELTNKYITKGNALNLFQKKYNIGNEELLVFGDSENDISMFKDRKYSIAMKNALPSAKQKSNFHADDHNNAGIFKMLTQFEKRGALSRPFS